MASHTSMRVLRPRPFYAPTRSRALLSYRYNNVASALCDDPASCCGSKQQLWNVTANGLIVSNVSGQCLTVHASGMTNVGTLPCSMQLEGLQTWTWVPTTQQFISSAAVGGVKSCLARTPDIARGATEIFAGDLVGGDIVVLLFNRNMPSSANITATWADLGLASGARYSVRDVWAHADLGVQTAFISASVEVHGSAVFRLSPVR